MVLIAIYLACDYATLFGRIEALSATPLLLLVFLALYGLCVTALVSAAFIPTHVGRLIVAALLAVGAASLHSYEWSTGSPFDYNSFETMLASSGDAGDAAAQHMGTLVKAGAAGLLLLLAIALPPRRKGLPFRMHWAVPGAVLMGLAMLIYVRGGEGTHGLPGAVTPIAYSGLKGVLLATSEDGPRQPVLIRPAGNPQRDIVLIVDESIAANYLDINNSGGVYSGLATPRPGIDIVNYGVAVAATNCSAGSNKTLRFGGTRENFGDVGKRNPSIWAYAHAAGLRTVYLDGQRSNGKLQNMATAAERAEIDDFVQLEGSAPVVGRDHRLAALLAKRLNNDIAEFIYVNKVGAHFPVADKFPDEAAIYRPIPPRGNTTRVIDMGPIHGSHTGSLSEWRLYRNAYRNTVIWNVGGFFDLLLPHVDPAKAVIVYTSDHGQDLHEHGQPGKATHCTSDPRPEEAAVPLVVLDSAQNPQFDWQASARHNFNRLSHFRIFPTMLALMGFRGEDTLATYGPSMVSRQRDPMTYTSTYHVSLGREPVWISLDPEKLQVPLASDDVQMARREDRRSEGGTTSKP